MSEKPAIFALRCSQSLSDMKDKKRIVINGNVCMDTVTVYSENQIKVDACPWMADKTYEVAPDGRVRLKGCTTIEPGASMVFRPYRIGSQGERYKRIFATRNGEIKTTRKSVIMELRFPKRFGKTLIHNMMSEEMEEMKAFMMSKRENTDWED